MNIPVGGITNNSPRKKQDIVCNLNDCILWRLSLCINRDLDAVQLPLKSCGICGIDFEEVYETIQTVAFLEIKSTFFLPVIF